MVIDYSVYKMLSDNAPTYLRRIIDALWFSGARPSEVLTAHTSEYNEPFISKQAHKGTHKGLRRSILCPPNISADINTRIASHPDTWLFPGEKGKPITSNDFSKRLKDLAKRLGIKEKVSGYTFRHSFACRLILKDVPVKKVATLLGHTTTAMVEKHYSHALEKIGQLRTLDTKIFDAMSA